MYRNKSLQRTNFFSRTFSLTLHATAGRNIVLNKTKNDCWRKKNSVAEPISSAEDKGKKNPNSDNVCKKSTVNVWQNDTEPNMQTRTKGRGWTPPLSAPVVLKKKKNCRIFHKEVRWRRNSLKIPGELPCHAEEESAKTLPARWPILTWTWTWSLRNLGQPRRCCALGRDWTAAGAHRETCMVL